MHVWFGAVCVRAWARKSIGRLQFKCGAHYCTEMAMQTAAPFRLLLLFRNLCKWSASLCTYGANERLLSECHRLCGFYFSTIFLMQFLNIFPFDPAHCCILHFASKLRWINSPKSISSGWQKPFRHSRTHIIPSHDGKTEILRNLLKIFAFAFPFKCFVSITRN